MTRYCWLLCVALAAGGAAAVAQESEFEGVEAGQAEEDDGTGRSLVIELDQGAGAAATGPAQPQALPDSDVELIIGGQGKDGLAKRSRLKKEE